MDMRFIAIIATVLTLSAGIAVSGAQAQSDDGGKGILGGLFNNGGGSSGGSPIFINRGNPSGASSGAGASRTGVARPTSRGGEGAIKYRVVPNKPQDEMSVGELIQQSTAEQNAQTDAYVERKKQEAAEMADMYRQQMRERLAAQSGDPSALQSMGAGGTGGVSGEQIRRKMIYEPDNSVTGGKKPIRLFNVR